MHAYPFPKFHLELLYRSISPWWLIFSMYFPSCFFFMFLTLVWSILCTLPFFLPRILCTSRRKYLLLILLQGFTHTLYLVHEFSYFRLVSVNIRCWFIFHPFLGDDTPWVIGPCEDVGEVHFFQLLNNLLTCCPAVENKRINLGFDPGLRFLLCCYKMYVIYIDHLPGIL